MSLRGRLTGELNGTPIAVELQSASLVLDSEGESVAIKIVMSPLARELKNPTGLLEALRENPEQAEELLAAQTAATQAEISVGDGVAYELIGAEPDVTSPMEYGGHFLERDRELLEAAKPPRFLIVRGGSETYTDVLADLPAEYVIWPERGPEVPSRAISIRDNQNFLLKSETTHV